MPAPSKPPEAEAEELDRAAAVLSDAAHPVVWAGGGVIASGASDELRVLAEALDAPVITTFAGKGAISASHPLCVGLPPHQPEVTKMLSAADALLVVGSDLDGMNTQGWRLPLPRPRVVINVEPDDLKRNYAADVAICSDARPALVGLAARVERRRRPGAAKRVERLRDTALRGLRETREFKNPLRFLDRLRSAIPDDAFVAADMAIPGYWAAAYFPVAAPRTFAYPLGWGTLGFALPAAIGVAASGKRAVVLCGDAGLLFGVGELATAVQEDLAVTLVVVNDNGYGMLRYDEDERFGDRFAVDLTTPDLVTLARSFGVRSRLTTLDALERDVRWAIRQRAPTLLELRAAWAPPITTSPRWPLRGKPEARP